MYKTIVLTILSFLLFSISVQADPNAPKTQVSGKIVDKNNQPLEAVTIQLLNSNYGTYTNEKGEFNFKAAPGKYTIAYSLVGYKMNKASVHIEDKPMSIGKVQMEISSMGLEEVMVVGKSKAQEIRESAFNVVAVDTKQFYNSNMDISKVLDKISGVKIREDGGVGSGAQVTLNGFTGRHVKIFMDGVPMNHGSAFGINNIPINMTERVEVYKGVVPIEFGGDAIGGAINIVTKYIPSTYVDASYSYGSFNTHRSNVSFGTTHKSGLHFSVQAYQNYSDNDYKITAPIMNLETGVLDGEKRKVKRFHDSYHNEAILAKVGIVNKSWADRMLLGFTYSQEDADVQMAKIVDFPYGGKTRNAKVISPNFTYEKKNLFFENLHFGVDAVYNKSKNQNVDTLARQYNWLGEYREKSFKGEGLNTLGRYQNENTNLVARLNYSILGKHYFTLTNTLTTYQRKNRDEVADIKPDDMAKYMRRRNTKNIIGLSYKFVLNDKFNASAFAKYYDVNVKAPVDVSTSTQPVFERQTRNANVTGFGATITYLLTRDLQAKLSAEKSVRLPSDTELFGDENITQGDDKLKPEHSRNLNLGLGYDKIFDNTHSVFVDAAFIYRDTRDFIREQVNYSKGGMYFTNHGKVSTIGFDVEAKYMYKNALALGGNFTWQNIRNKEKLLLDGRDSPYYDNRMPNMPYMFSNVDASYTFHSLMTKQDQLVIGYGMRYVAKFNKSWTGLQGGDAIMTDNQLSHDLYVNYVMKGGRYNIAFQLNNFTDERLFDNFDLEKPGRNMAIKFRYFFSKNNK